MPKCEPETPVAIAVASAVGSVLAYLPEPVVGAALTIMVARYVAAHWPRAGADISRDQLQANVLAEWLDGVHGLIPLEVKRIQEALDAEAKTKN